MRRPIKVALADTAALLAKATTQRSALRAGAQLIHRLPGALARRIPPTAQTEAKLRRLTIPDASVPVRVVAVDASAQRPGS